jgi:hypothetical protein
MITGRTVRTDPICVRSTISRLHLFQDFVGRHRARRGPTSSTNGATLVNASRLEAIGCADRRTPTKRLTTSRLPAVRRAPTSRHPRSKSGLSRARQPGRSRRRAMMQPPAHNPEGDPAVHRDATLRSSMPTHPYSSGAERRSAFRLPESGLATMDGAELAFPCRVVRERSEVIDARREGGALLEVTPGMDVA